LYQPSDQDAWDFSEGSQAKITAMLAVAYWNFYRPSSVIRNITCRGPSPTEQGTEWPKLYTPLCQVNPEYSWFCCWCVLSH